MRRALWIAAVGLLPTALPLSCGSLAEGEVVIVDEGAGAPSGGGASGNAGKGGSGTAGGTSGKGGSSGKGGGSGDAGEAGVGTGANGGSGNAGQGGSSNGGQGGSANAGTGTGGGAGEPPSDCVNITDCAGTKPICDDGTCRACAVGAMPDECADLTSTPHCLGMIGTCVACLENDDCTSSRSVCDNGVCRGCESGSECDSGACNSGRCADESTVVYVSDTGSYDTTMCGTRDLPCRDPGDGATLLSASRPFLVILFTSGGFYTQIKLPPMTDGLAVFGNGVKLSGYDAPVITMSGGSVLLENVVVEADGSGTGVANLAGVDCVDSNLKVFGGSFSNLSTSYDSAAMHLTNCTAEIRQAEFSNSRKGLISWSSQPIPLQSLTLERSRLQGNVEALDVAGNYFLIRNNLFVSNGQTSYVRIIRLSAQAPSVFAYNTLYGNDNNCSYEGGLVVCSGTVEGCGTQSSNLFWNNMFNGSGSSGSMPCPDQVYGYPPPISYTLAETTWPGTGNLAADPLLTNLGSDDFTPGEGSPAIDAGETDATLVPTEDYYGNPRPVGSSPDIGAVEVQ